MLLTLNLNNFFSTIRFEKKNTIFKLYGLFLGQEKWFIKMVIDQVCKILSKDDINVWEPHVAHQED
jgi:hypothetical protein